MQNVGGKVSLSLHTKQMEWWSQEHWMHPLGEILLSPWDIKDCTEYSEEAVLLLLKCTCPAFGLKCHLAVKIVNSIISTSLSTSAQRRRWQTANAQLSGHALKTSYAAVRLQTCLGVNPFASKEIHVRLGFTRSELYLWTSPPQSSHWFPYHISIGRSRYNLF